jgi:Uma2 family endonuclease
MVALPLSTQPATEHSQVNASVNQVAITLPQSIDEFMLAPVKNTEWVDGRITEKVGMTIKHGQVQSRLDFAWRNYALAQHQGGEPLTEAPCRTQKQVRRPDVAYATDAFLAKIGTVTTAPESFPLIAEIASPTDPAEELFSKAQEYLQSGCEEVWLIFPENHWILVLTPNQHLWFVAGEVAYTQVILPGFSIAVDVLLA